MSCRINAIMPGVTDIVSAVIPCLGEEAAIGRGRCRGAGAEASHEVIVVDGRSRGPHGRAGQRPQALGLSSSRGVAMAAPFKPASPPLRDDAEHRRYFSMAMAAILPEYIPDLGRSSSQPGSAVFAAGSRIRGAREPGSFLATAASRRAWSAVCFCARVYGAGFTDLSPFRAIRRDEFGSSACATELMAGTWRC